MRSRFAFVHVPKSAGSSIKNAVARRCHPATVAPWELDRVLFGGFDRFGDMRQTTQALIAVDGAAALTGYDVVMGHFGISSFAPHFAANEMMTVLREPRTRLLSHYTFWRGWSAERHADWAPYAASRRAVDATWEEFLTDPSIASQTDNIAIRMLLSPHRLIPADDVIAPTDHDELTGEGIAWLDDIGFVDVVESGSALWEGLSTWLDTDVEPERTLITPPAGDIEWLEAITPAAAAALMQRTAIDSRLWEHVARRTHADVTALGEATFHRKLVSVAAGPPANEENQDAWRRFAGSPTGRARRLVDRFRP